MNLVIVLFLTLSNALGLNDGADQLFCADRTTFTLRESTVDMGCLDNERSLGSAAITKAKKDVAGVHPKLNLRFKVAQKVASDQGVDLYIASGFRTLERQKYLFEQAVQKYGSERKAAKWVLPPNISNHPRGLALDINYPGNPAGAAWLEANGYLYGLCRVFDNEWWHFEATTRPGEVCPPRLANAAKLIDWQ